MKFGAVAVWLVKWAQSFSLLPEYIRAIAGQWMSILFGETVLGAIFLLWWVLGQPPLILIFVSAMLVATYFAWHNERQNLYLTQEGYEAQMQDLRSAKQKELEAFAAERCTEVAALNERIAVLSRKPYSEELKRIAATTLDYEMTLEGRHVLRYLMVHEPVEVGRVFIREIPEDRQHAELGIAMERGIVQHKEEGQRLLRTYWIINPRFRPVLEDVLYEDERR